MTDSALLHRPRRLRQNSAIRRMVREHALQPADLVHPLFIVPGQGIRNPVPSMPGVAQLSIDEAIRVASQSQNLGIPAIILFGIPEVKDKDPSGSDARNPDGIIQQAIRAIKKSLPDLYVIADLCYCEYTDHGHCGVLRNNPQPFQNEQEVDNDATLALLGAAACSYAAAGVDMVAPSGMMDGMVAAIRNALDQQSFSHIPILSYAVKYASAYYGPFRDAAESTPTFGDRRSYQMDPANRREALREASLDIAQGADMLMVKPGLAYLDILRDLRERCDLPLAVYNVSGEYAMVKAAAAHGWIDEKRVIMENLTAFKRAGADLILTYHAPEAARLLQEGYLG
ncbi:MAG: porphobilinogen synthase [Magnetococcales bacterium]|nr:porphobilinogen synthase [Magnetococcales bacterium]MBF0114948.1 porphobilinogen synthase [Magnetococcales bacterium]